MYSPFRPFVRGTVILRDLTKHGYSPFTSWDDYPSILCETKAIPTWLSCLRKENQQTTNICVWKLGLHCIHRSNGLKCPTMNPHRNSNHAIHSLHLLSRSRNLLLHLSHLSGSCGNMSAIHVFFFPDSLPRIWYMFLFSYFFSKPPPNLACCGHLSLSLVCVPCRCFPCCILQEDKS